MSSIVGIQNQAIQQLASQANVGNVSQANLIQPDKPAPDSGGFANQLMDVMNQVNDTQQTADSKQMDFMTGRRDVDYQDLMISMEKASVALQLTVSVRNKLLEAYQQISQTQI